MLTPFLTVTLLLLSSNQDPDRVSWERISRRLDTDGNGEITREEFQRRYGTPCERRAKEV